MTESAQHNILSEGEIISAYMELTDTFDGIPNVDQVCEYLTILEENFFEFFDSVYDLDRIIWKKLMEQSVQTLQNDTQFAQYSNQDKLLSLFYTFFENLSLNRAFILANLSNYPSTKKRRRLYEEMKPIYLQTIEDIFKGNPLHLNQKFLDLAASLKNKSLGESLWLQLTLLIAFWKKDTSPELVKTDAAIEKSVQVVMDLMDTSRIKNFIDFGKFLWNEKENLTRKK